MILEPIIQPIQTCIDYEGGPFGSKFYAIDMDTATDDLIRMPSSTFGYLTAASSFAMSLKAKFDINTTGSMAIVGVAHSSADRFAINCEGDSLRARVYDGTSAALYSSKSSIPNGTYTFDLFVSYDSVTPDFRFWVDGVEQTGMTAANVAWGSTPRGNIGAAAYTEGDWGTIFTLTGQVWDVKIWDSAEVYGTSADPVRWFPFTKSLKDIMGSDDTLVLVNDASFVEIPN